MFIIIYFLHNLSYRRYYIVFSGRRFCLYIKRGDFDGIKRSASEKNRFVFEIFVRFYCVFYMRDILSVEVFELEY